MKPKILIVDDEKNVVRDVSRHIESIDGTVRSRCGVDGFELEWSYDVADAKAKLTRAADDHSPFTLVLLDLELPNVANGQESRSAGFEILKHAVERRAAVGVIIVSAFAREYDEVVRAFELADGFLSKDSQKKVPRLALQERLLDYFQAKSKRILEEQQKDLYRYDRRLIVYRLGKCFSDCANTVLDTTDQMKAGFHDRWGLDWEVDVEDKQVRQLAQIEAAVRRHRQEWEKLQRPVADEEITSNECVLESVFKEVTFRIRPCLMLKHVKLDSIPEGHTRVRDFDSDVRFVLTELLLGALSEVPDTQQSDIQLDAFLDIRNGKSAELQLQDGFSAIPKHLADAISSGRGMVGDFENRRVDGLIIAQQVASRADGALSIKPRGRVGNIVTFRIPLA